MKRTNLFAASAICFAALVSCQKELTENVTGEGSKNLISKTLYAEGNDWVADTKTVYEPGTGIVWTGNESMDIFYGAAGGSEGASGTNPYMRHVSGIVTNNNDGTYSFSHDAISGVDLYDYCVITPVLPSSRASKTNSDGTSIIVEFSPLQMPGQNTYDPNYDLLYGKGEKGVSAAENLTINQFKRISTPLKLELVDNDGVAAGESIRAVTASFGKETTNHEALAGLFYMSVGIDDYDACSINSINPAGNAVTAVYADGLAKQSEIYPVWYMVNPSVFESGTGLVLTVVTDAKTITKTITLPEELNVMTGKFNSVKLNISGNNSSSVASLYQDFTSLPEGAISSSPLTASDGQSYAWGFDGCEISANAPLPAGLAIGSGASVTLPTIPGYKITGIRLYANPDNANSSNTVALNGGTSMDFNSYVEGGLVATGGVLEIDVPEDIQGQTLTLTSTGRTVLSGIAFELAEDSGSAADFENDYYAQYIAGRDIIINGEIYNIANNGEAKLVDVSEMTIADINDGGVIFVDNTDASEEKAINGNIITGAAIVIGRYRDSQPAIKFETTAGAANQVRIQADIVLKNMSISSSHTASMFVCSDAAANISLTLEDCTLTNTAGSAILRDAGTNASVENVAINNCVIEFAEGCNSGSCVIAYHSSKTDFSAKSMKVNNCVIYAPTTFPAGIISLGYNGLKTTTADVEIGVTDNTLYNITSPNVVVRAWQAKSLVVNNNVAYNESDGVKSYLTAIYDETFTPEKVEVTGNYLYTPFVSGSNSWSLMHTGSYQVNPEDNFLHSQAQNCILTDQVNLETGYIPVNTSVVANGAGADYDTKYWIAR